MSQILVLYASDYGNTEKMAQAVAAGAQQVAGVRAVVKKAEEATVEDLQASEGIIIGSPVHMGSVDWRVKKFIDTVCSAMWMQDGLIGKVGGVFASGSGFGNGGGGAELTLLALLSNLAELGLVIIPLPKNTPGYPQGGLHWGPYGRTANSKLEPVGVGEDALLTARHHGEHIAKAVVALAGKGIF